MKLEDMLSYNPEMERCRQVREAIDRQYKTPSEALAHLGEISRARRKADAAATKLAKAATVKARKKSA